MKVAIIGSGFSGLGMGIKLQELGIPYIIIEKASEVGGTWYYNTYPGCACDIPSHLYSFSYEVNNDWSEVYSPQGEIEEYLKRTAKKYNLYPHIRFNTFFDSAKFDEKEAKWRIRTLKDGKEEFISANFLVSGVGGLHIPNFPDIPGKERFEGLAFHTSLWDERFYELKNKKVAIIGSAASAIQIIPTILSNDDIAIDKLYVFQRTANWIAPRLNYPYSPFFRSLITWVPFFQQLLRYVYYLRQEFLLVTIFRSGSIMNSLASKYLRYLIRSSVKEKECYDGTPLASALTPSYPPGCKRVLLSNDFYPSLASPRVSVVTNPIKEITKNGILVDVNGKLEEIEVDVLIYSTGFQVLVSSPNVISSNDMNLNDVWLDTPKCYLGILTPKFPNFFVLLGPNTGLGHNSVVWMIECQVNLVAKLICETLERDCVSIDTKEEYNNEFQTEVQQKLKNSVWSRKNCNSWYQNSRGDIYSLWYGHTFTYWYKCLTAPMKAFVFK